MIDIEKIMKIDKKRIALMDTSSISFIQSLQNKGIKIDSILKDYELILIPGWSGKDGIYSEPSGWRLSNLLYC